jgi:cytochrome b6-f complex iron-sulfur subunit
MRRKIAMAADNEALSSESSCPCNGDDVSVSRRKVITGLGWGAFFATIGLSSAGLLRFLYPRVLFEPPATFKIGTPTDYPAGEPDAYGVVSVSEKFMVDQRVWIVRETDRLYAVFGKCTHLGCTPRWFAEDRQYKCPCHGSKYYSNAVNFAGPAPRPMDRYAIHQLEDGRIVVDRSSLFTFKEFDNPKAFVKV